MLNLIATFLKVHQKPVAENELDKLAAETGDEVEVCVTMVA